ncbi:hypothetical protein M4I33_08840 [Clostridium sp. LY3-2]|uniref:putative ABC transporter permease subunit n=1 Tax=Clostridium sp. LY3-2 TaxID=2942482 RepID=UPI00215287AA|nr:hypothetical protein [Clostridium sp. LY3-2]MCR6514981.1 hypothetical protein [Clostridium sp. LY3-2]
MRSRLYICLKFFFKNSLKELFNFGSNPLIGVGLCVLVCFLLNLPLVLLVNGLFKAYESLNQVGSLISLLLFIGASSTFIMGIYTVFNNFFFSNDVDYLMPLPFKPGEIMLGKFVSTFIVLYFYAAIIILPLLQIGDMAGYSSAYFIMVFVVIILLPILPLGYCILISLLLMRLTNVSKNKDVFKIIGGVLGLAFVVLINRVTSNSSFSETEMVEMLTKENGMMDVLNGAFITNKFAAEGLVSVGNSGSFSSIFIYVIISILIIAFVYFLGQFFYKKAIMGSSETFSKKENILKNKKVKLEKESPLKALIKRDLIIIFRTPSFFLNCVVMLIYFPAIIFVTSSTGNLVDIGGEALSKTGFVDFYLPMVVMLPSMIFMTGFGLAAPNALSREGKNVIISKYIPVDYKVQYKAKVISSLIINMLGVIISIAFLIYLKMPFKTVVLGGILSFLSVLVITLFGVYMDYSNPKLDWTDEKQCGDGGIKHLINFVLLIILGLILGGSGYVIGKSTEFSINTAAIVVFALNVVVLISIALALYKMSLNRVFNTYKEHEI